MLKIAHRGNIAGANPLLENQPSYLLEAINSGFDVEVDLWYENGKIFLGHDCPTYEVEESFILYIGLASWFHCKNLEALHFLNTVYPQLNYFWHENDKFTLTSQGYIWTYPGGEVTDKSVIVALDGIVEGDCYAICADSFTT